MSVCVCGHADWRHPEQQGKRLCRAWGCTCDEFRAHADRYFICDECGHYWSAPEHPDRCENCGADAGRLMFRDTLAEAEETSETVLTTER